MAGYHSVPLIWANRTTRRVERRADVEPVGPDELRHPTGAACTANRPGWSTAAGSHDVLAEIDPVTAHTAVLAVANAFEDAAIAFDRLDRRDVVYRADDHNPVHAGVPRLFEHLAQRPGGQPSLP